ncbi:MAG: hypothetical protein AB8G15_16115 [Saprospiraceae bacterium]
MESNAPLSDSRYKVFGSYPNWMGSTIDSLSLDNFTDISYFSYNIDPVTGDCTSLSRKS